MVGAAEESLRATAVRAETANKESKEVPFPPIRITAVEMSRMTSRADRAIEAREVAWGL